jgi:hypothetical protein
MALQTKRSIGDGIKQLWEIPTGCIVRAARVNGVTAPFTQTASPDYISITTIPPAGQTVDLDIENFASIDQDDDMKNGFAITPSDTVELPKVTSRIWVGVTGNIKVDLVGGDTVTLTAVPVGMLAVKAVRLYATGTTATTMVGFA